MSFNALVYDIEIVKAIPDKGKERLEGIEYCDGWHDHANMGVSVVGAYDFVESRYRVFCRDNFAEFLTLANGREHRISFNGVGFDDKVISSCLPREICNGIILHSKHYDILQEVWLAAGGRFKGSGLDALCVANGLGGKTGHGALAPVQWQRGEIGAVIDYCLCDVRLTKELFELCQRGPIKRPGGGTLELRRVV